jgi:hypothetical protein
MMLNIFYPMNHDFLVNHNGACISHYWCNWDASNLASMISIGVLCDRQDIFDEAVAYYQNGAGNGSIWNAVLANGRRSVEGPIAAPSGSKFTITMSTAAGCLHLTLTPCGFGQKAAETMDRIAQATIISGSEH